MDTDGCFRFVAGYADSVIGDEIEFASAGGGTASVLEFKRPGKTRALPRLTRQLAAMAAIFICFVAVAFGVAWNYTPNYLYVDINPSVEAAFNCFGRAASVKDLHADDAKLAGGEKIGGPYGAVVESLLSRAASQGYKLRDAEGKPYVFILFAATNAHKAETICADLSTYLQARGYSGVVCDFCSMEYRARALALGVSPGRLKIAEQLQGLGCELPLEDILKMTVADIFTALDEYTETAAAPAAPADKSETANPPLSKAIPQDAEQPSLKDDGPPPAAQKEQAAVAPPENVEETVSIAEEDTPLSDSGPSILPTPEEAAPQPLPEPQPLPQPGLADKDNTHDDTPGDVLPDLSITVAGQLKVNRKITADGTVAGFASGTVALSIKPHTSAVDTAIRIDTKSSRNDHIEFLVKQAGVYEVTFTFTRAGRKTSVSELIEVAEDAAPVADFAVEECYYLNYGGTARIVATDNSYSPDEDDLGPRHWEIVYGGNSKDDFAAGEPEIVENGEYTAKKAGFYRLSLTVTEEYSDTIKELLGEEDFLSGSATKIFEVRRADGEVYEHPNYQNLYFTEPRPHSILISDDGALITMLGYNYEPYTDFLYKADYDAGYKSFTFDLDIKDNEWHSLGGCGLLFNTEVANGTINGYSIMVTGGSVQLLQIDNISTENFMAGAEVGEPIYYKDTIGNSGRHSLRIDTSPEAVTVWYNGVLVIDNYPLPSPSSNYGYGPIASYLSHSCDYISQATFSNLRLEYIFPHALPAMPEEEQEEDAVGEEETEEGSLGEEDVWEEDDFEEDALEEDDLEEAAVEEDDFEDDDLIEADTEEAPTEEGTPIDGADYIAPLMLTLVTALKIPRRVK